jgi:hypothetical protein
VNALLALAAMSAGLFLTLYLFGTPIRIDEIAGHLIGPSAVHRGIMIACFESAR